MTTYADGATATIQVASGVNTSQSGLTPGAKYYVQPNGSLSTTPATVSVLAGTAISATKFLVSSSLITAHPDPELPAPGASGKILKSDGTNWVSGDEAELPAAGAANKVLTSDGTNWIAGEALPAPSTAGKLLTSDGTNWTSATAPTELPAAGTAGKVLTSDGTDWIAETQGPFFQAEASGTLADGDKVILRSDGKVEKAANAALLLAPPSSDSQATSIGVRVPSPNHPVHAQATSSPAQGNSPPCDTPSQKAWISYDPNDENKFIVAYDNINSPGRTDAISVIIGTISGTTISFGTAVTVDGQYWASDHSPPVCHYHPSTPNLFAVGYAGSGSGDIRLYFGTVSGTSITMASYWESSLSGTWYGRRGGSCAFSWCNVSTTNHFVFMFNGGTVAYSGPNTGKFARNHPKLVAGTVSNTGTGASVTGGYGTDIHPYLEINDDKWWYGIWQVRSLRFDPNNANKFLVTSFKNESSTSSTPTLFICTTNGSTSITIGAEHDLKSSPGFTGIGEHHCEWNPGIANQIVFSGQQAFSGTSNDIDPVFCVGTVSGTSVSWGALYRVVPTASHSGETSQPWEIFFGNGNATGRFYGATSLHPVGGLAGNIDVQAFQITGTTIAAVGGTAAIAPHQWFDSFNNASHIGVPFPWHVEVSPSGNKFMVSALTGTGSGNHTKFTSGTIYQAGTRNLTSSNFIGISDGAYGAGATATIQVAGATDDAQSGLTIGAVYYLQEDGTLSTTPDKNERVLAGTAISATKLLIAEGTTRATTRALGTLKPLHQGLFL